MARLSLVPVPQAAEVSDRALDSLLELILFERGMHGVERAIQLSRARLARSHRVSLVREGWIV